MTAVADRQKRALAQPAFVFVASVLLICALVLNFTAARKGLHFKKSAVPQPRDFHDIPEVMGPWLQVSMDSKLDKEMEDVLATDKYVFRDYINVEERGADLLDAAARMGNTNALADSVQEADQHSVFLASPFNQQVGMIKAALKDKTYDQRRALVLQLQLERPEGVIDMALTYYTGMADTVAHIPDRCYIADGYDVSTYDVSTWDLRPDPSSPPRPLQVRLINFEDQTGNNRIPKFVAYVFHTDGHYESDPLGVRQTLQSLTQRYGYYAKIELMTVGKDSALAKQTMIGFLSAAQPQIERCFPDWAKLTRGGPTPTGPTPAGP